MKLEIIEAVKRRLQVLRRTAGEIIKMQENEPDGSLRITTRDGKALMYHRSNSKDRNGKYISQNDSELACRLAEKGYLIKALKSIKAEEAHLQKYIDDCAGNTFEQEYEKLTSIRQKMTVPVVETDEMFAARWNSQKYIQKPSGDGTDYYKSKRGDLCRSKSEYIIADELYYAGIPYRYECKTVIDNIPIYPDFTILNVARRKEFIWEHMGKLSDPEYAESATVKLNTYMSGGYYPGVNLLLTFESSKTPIKVELVRNMISTFLLK
ncbi:MAG: hypothetical protein IJM24_03805 [Clostridia bacterium]|nr:hypothetical protein [Clostridia bacterium]